MDDFGIVGVIGPFDFHSIILKICKNIDLNS